MGLLFSFYWDFVLVGLHHFDVRAYFGPPWIRGADDPPAMIKHTTHSAQRELEYEWCRFHADK